MDMASQDTITISLTLAWWNIPSLALGAWAGVHAWNTSLKKTKKKDN